MPPAARIGDMHTCPVTTLFSAHVGGPILPPCAPKVLIGSMPAARVGDMATCAGPPDVIAKGSPTVLIECMMAARVGDPTVHGGMIVVGSPTVFIGDAPGPLATSTPPTFPLSDLEIGAAGGAGAENVSPVIDIGESDEGDPAQPLVPMFVEVDGETKLAGWREAPGVVSDAEETSPSVPVPIFVEFDGETKLAGWRNVTAAAPDAGETPPSAPVPIFIEVDGETKLAGWRDATSEGEAE